MPNTSQDVINYWRDRVEIDYYTQFIKAYIVFNAWYRKRFGDGSERNVIDSVKNDIGQNPVRSAIVGKFTSGAPDAEDFRTLVGALHRSLTSYALVNSKGHSVTFTSVFVSYNRYRVHKNTHNGIEYNVNAATANSILVTVTQTKNTKIIFRVNQTEYDWEALKAAPGFDSLSGTQVSNLQNYYLRAHPLITEDLTNTQNGAILCGTTPLCDNPPYLFSGLIEIIYDLRNLLFHGEIIPSSETSEIYQAAYNILLRIIKTIP